MLRLSVCVRGEGADTGGNSEGDDGVVVLTSHQGFSAGHGTRARVTVMMMKKRV